MILPLVFWMFLAGAIAIGWQAGDRADRRVLLTIFVTAAATSAAHNLAEYPLSNIVVVLIDIALLIFVVRYALVSDRHWPVWFAGYHAASIILSISGILLPKGDNDWLTIGAAFWALPALAFMAAGLLMDQRRGIRNTVQ